MPREVYELKLTRPAGVTVARMKDYIAAAVETWSGQLRPPGAYGQDDPGDPLFQGTGKVKVRRKGNQP